MGRGSTMLALDELGLGAISRRPITHHRKKALGSLHSRNLGFNSHQAREGERSSQDQAKGATSVQDPAATLRGLALRSACTSPSIQAPSRTC